MGPTIGTIERLDERAWSSIWARFDNAMGVAGDNERGDFDDWLDCETCSSPSPVLFSCLPLSVCIGFGRAGDENMRGVEAELPDFDTEEFREESRRPLFEPML